MLASAMEALSGNLGTTIALTPVIKNRRIRCVSRNGLHQAEPTTAPAPARTESVKSGVRLDFPFDLAAHRAIGDIQIIASL